MGESSALSEPAMSSYRSQTAKIPLLYLPKEELRARLGEGVEFPEEHILLKYAEVLRLAEEGENGGTPNDYNNPEVIESHLEKLHESVQERLARMGRQY